MKPFLHLLFLTLTLTGGFAYAQKGEVFEQSVDDLVLEAMAHNAELRAYESVVEAARGERTQAGLWKNPELEAEYGERRVTEATGALKGKGYVQGISIRQTFEFPGKGSLRKAIADQNIHIAELGLAQFKASLAGQVRLLALRYTEARETAELAAEIKERSTSLIDLLRKRSLAGTQALLELRLIEASLVELQKTARESIQERDEVRLELNALLGRPHSKPLNIRTPGGLPSAPGDLNELVLSGLGHSRLLKMREAELDRAGRETTAARLDAAPDFSVGPFYSEEKAGDKEVNVGISLSVPLPLWNWNQGNIESAKARQKEADALLLSARFKLEEQVARRHRALTLVLAQMAETPAEAEEQFAAAADLADRQYRTGAIPVQMFLEMQRSALNARQILGQTRIEAWRQWLDLQLLTGAADSGKKSKGGRP